MRVSKLLTKTLAPLGLALGLGLSPAIALACGGIFCDGSLPTPMPVDQTGEDILFIRDGDQLEVHVRIQYSGEAERFAWIVPLPAVPEVRVGVDAIFPALSAATLPVWSMTRVFENPDDDPGAGTGGGGGGSFVPDSDLGGGGSNGPDIVFEETVGSFEVVVLQGGAASEVIQFFIDNDYAFNDDAEPLIQEYLDEGFLMTGVKLVAGAEVDEIHPLAFRFPSDEPCIPLRLTSVAVADDMPIRAYFLGEERWAPANYKHVILNPLAFDWVSLNFGTYLAALSLAIDEAGGQGFVTEFAGPSHRVALGGVYQSQWSSEELASLTAREVLLVLRAYGLLPYPGEGPGPQLRQILREFMAVPGNWGGTEDQFWWAVMTSSEEGGFDPGGIMTNNGLELEQPDWDMPGLAAGLEERVIEPGRHLDELFDAHPRLTRLHTMMSGHEMTLDPTFHAVPELPGLVEARETIGYVFSEVTHIAYTVPYEISGTGPTVDSEAQLCVEGNGAWPLDVEAIAGMPRALRVEEVPASGPPQIVIDNDLEIRIALAEYNLGTPCETEIPMPPDTGDSGSSSTGEAGASEEGGASCGCSTNRERGPLAVLLGLLGLAGLGLVRRRD